MVRDEFAEPQTEVYHTVPPCCIVSLIIVIFVGSVPIALASILYNPLVWNSTPCTIVDISNRTLDESYEHYAIVRLHVQKLSLTVSLQVCKSQSREEALLCARKQYAIFNSTVCVYHAIPSPLLGYQIQFKELATQTAVYLWPPVFALVLFAILSITSTVLLIDIYVYGKLISGAQLSTCALCCAVIRPKMPPVYVAPQDCKDQQQQQQQQQHIPRHFCDIFQEHCEYEAMLWTAKVPPKQLLNLPYNIYTCCAASLPLAFLGFSILGYMFHPLILVELLGLALIIYYALAQVLVSASHTCYVITSDKLVVLSTWFISSRIDFVPFGELRELDVTARADGSGSIVFGHLSASNVGFFNIDSVRQVADIIEAQRQYLSNNVLVDELVSMPVEDPIETKPLHQV